LWGDDIGYSVPLAIVDHITPCSAFVKAGVLDTNTYFNGDSGRFFTPTAFNFVAAGPMKFPREFPDIPETCGGDPNGGSDTGGGDDDDGDDCTTHTTSRSDDYADYYLAEKIADAAWYECENNSFEYAANRTANGTCSSVTTDDHGGYEKDSCDSLWYCVKAFYYNDVAEDAIDQRGPPSRTDEAVTDSDSFAAVNTPTTEMSKLPVVPVTVAEESLNKAETAGAGEEVATTDEEAATTDEEAATTDEEAATADEEAATTDAAAGGE